MDLTPQDLWTLRNIVIRAVNETHEVLANAARRARQDRRREDRAADVPAPVQPPTPPPAPPTRDEVPKLAYTLKEASAALGLSRSTLYKMIAEGRLATLRLGSRRLIARSAIEALLDGAKP